ncbi:aminoglycoside phosphotransferase domain-containing protein 1 [Trichonephila clavipes]|nr:aminoglycoside phosphotransferase domain-containing protein 1 [Trichonephila clavipes]
MHSALIHLNEKGLRVPVPVRNLEGNTWKLEEVPLVNEDKESAKNNKCAIHLITFLPGVTLNTLEVTNEMFFQWGALLAQFHNGTEDLICPDLAKKPIFYNLDHVLDIRKYTQGLPEEHCNLVFNVLDKEQYDYDYIHLDFFNRIVPAKCDHGSLVIKVSDRGWLVTSSRPVPLKTRRVGERCTLNLSRAQTSFRCCGVVVRIGRCQLRYRPRHLTMVQNDEVHRQKPLCS